MDVAERIHEQLTKCGIKLAASLPDDWVAPLIERIAADNHIRHVRVDGSNRAPHLHGRARNA
jgi:sulfopyruvate decarboxylase subunit alpha